MSALLKKLSKQVEDSPSNPSVKDAQLSRETKDLIPSGSTLLNLACSGNPYGAYSIGKMTNIIGDSDAGKTVLALSALAECCKLTRFNDYALIYRDIERALEIDLESMFSEELAARIDMGDEEDVPHTIEEFGDEILRLLDKGKPFIYVLDSFDALTSTAEIEKELENAKKREAGKDETGSYGDGKAKIFSKWCRQHIHRIRRNNSHVIIISQTRDNIGFGAMFTPKTRSGGHALKFYATHEMWGSLEKKIDKTVKGVKYQVGSDVELRVSKNKITGRKSKVYFPILFGYGVDDTTSCVNYLIDHKYWKKDSGGINATELNVKMAQDALVRYIEKNKLMPKVIELVTNLWNEIAETLKPDREPKY